MAVTRASAQREEGAKPLTVTWSTKTRIVGGLAIPVLAALAWWSFTAEEQASVGAGIAFIAMTAAAAFLEIYFVRFRIDIGDDGLHVRDLGPARFVRWEDMQRVDVQGAFYVLVHARGRIYVHASIDGAGALVASMSGSGVPQPESPRRRARSVVQTTTSVIESVWIGIALTFLTWGGGVFVVLSNRIRVIDGGFLDGALVACLPLVAFFAMLRALRLRSLGWREAVYLYGSFVGGPAMLWFGLPMLAREGANKVSLFCTITGALLVYFVVRDVRALRR